MFVLFLILCYFILIFNIIVPKIAEKLRLEHNALLRYRQIYGNKFRCINDTLVNYNFTPRGIKATHLIHTKTQQPVKCDDPSTDETKVQLLNFILNRSTCEHAYIELFL